MVDLDPMRSLLLTPSASVVLKSESEKAVARKLATIAHTHLNEAEIEARFGRLSQPARDLFFSKIDYSDEEICQIVFLGDDESLLESLKQTTFAQKLSAPSDGPKLLIAHFNALDPEKIADIENNAADQDFTITSIFIRNLHVVIGPVSRSLRTPRFSDFYENWALFEENRLNDNRSWHAVIDFGLKAGIPIGLTMERDAALEGLATFHISKCVAKLVSADAPYYTWEDAFGTSVCDLDSGTICFEPLVHSVFS